MLSVDMASKSHAEYERMLAAAVRHHRFVRRRKCDLSNSALPCGVRLEPHHIGIWRPRHPHDFNIATLDEGRFGPLVAPPMGLNMVVSEYEVASEVVVCRRHSVQGCRPVPHIHPKFGIIDAVLPLLGDNERAAWRRIYHIRNR